MKPVTDRDAEQLERLLLDSFSEDRPPAGSKQALLAGLGLGSSAFLTTSTAVATAGASKVSGAVSGITAAVIAKAFAVGVVVGTAFASGATYIAHAPEPLPVRRPQAEAASMSSSTRSSALATAAPKPATEQAAATPSPTPQVIGVPKRTAFVPASKPEPEQQLGHEMPSESTLEREIRALDQAKRALSSGDTQEALRQIAEYRRLYPRANLAQEAVLIEIEANLKLGRLSEANALAERFASQYPSSTHLLRIRSLLKTK